MTVIATRERRETMKSAKLKKLSKRMRQLLAAQVQEYVDDYHPHWGKVSVDISPSGTMASVRSNPKAGRPGANKGESNG